MDTAARISLACFLIGWLAACGGGGGTPAAPPVTGTGPADCVAGQADGYSCGNIALAKHVTLAELGATGGNDVWGWTDPANNFEYALMGVNNGTVFVNITDPQNPQVVGKLSTHTNSSPWRDIKVYQNFAFIVADAAGSHGMQVFDLTRLRTGGLNQVFSADLVYPDFGSAHNIAINEASGYAYIVGSNTCNHGLHMINISQPLNPMFAGCHTDDGATHDAQCVNYIGPDLDHVGKEICFNSNEDTVAIVDVTIKSSPVTLSEFTYPNLTFVHQGWVDEAHQYMVINDEFDEINIGLNTGSIVIDVTDLDAAHHIYTHRQAIMSTDHNLYIRGDKIYEANYKRGLRVLQFTTLATDTMTEVAYFDTHPDSNATGTNGAWSVYPYFPSNTIVVSDTDRGLFILTPN